MRIASRPRHLHLPGRRGRVQAVEPPGRIASGERARDEPLLLRLPAAGGVLEDRRNRVRGGVQDKCRYRGVLAAYAFPRVSQGREALVAG